MSDDLDVRRRRAGFRANHRGTKEMDWLLGRFADATLAGMSGEDLVQFEKLMEIGDPELNAWILSPELCPEQRFAGLLYQIRQFHNLAE